MSGARYCRGTLLICLVSISNALAGKPAPTSSDALLSSSSSSFAATASPPPPRVYLHANFKLSNAQLAFFLRQAPANGQPIGGRGGGGPGPGHGHGPGPGPGLGPGHPLQRSESFVVFQTKELPSVNVSFGPFSQDRVLSKELLQPAGPLDIPGQLTVGWKVRAFIVQARVFSHSPQLQVFFYIAGRDWDDFRARDDDGLPCVRLHAFRDVREIKASCRMRGNLAQCLAQLQLPASWFHATVAPLGRRRGGGGDAHLDGLTGETLQAELYYTLHEPSATGECGGGEGAAHRAGGRAGQPASHHPLLRIGSISLYQAGPQQHMVDKQLDENVFLRLPEKPLQPRETLRVFLYLMPNSTVEQFTLKVKAKKGVNLIQTKSNSAQWKVDWEIQSGAKHSITTVDVTKNKGVKQGDVMGNVEVMQLDFEMENFTSLSVTRRINWNIDYKGQNPPPDSEKVVTELTVVQRDIQAIIPLSMDTEIINTAILTGRTVAIPVKMVSIEMNGAVTDVSSFVQCKSSNEDIVKVSMNCDYVFVNGKETRGSMSARVIFSYEHLSAPLELTVWVPKLPLLVELSDSTLSFIKGWRVPILPDRRSTRDSEAAEEEDEERRGSRGCTLQYQRALVRVLTQFHTTSAEGTDQVVTMLGPDWQVDVTDLVQDSLRVADPRVAELVDRTVLVGLEMGSSVLKVESPLAVDAMLGESSFSVTDDKVSVSELRVHAIAGLALSLQPSPGNSHTMVAKATGLQTLTAFKQEASLSIWMYFSDNTAAPLTHFDPKDYNLNASALDDKLASVSQEPQHQQLPTRWPVLVAEGEGWGEAARVEMTISEACQKTKRKSVIAAAGISLRVRFGPEEGEEEEGEEGPPAVTRRVVVETGGGRVYDASNEQPASVPIDYTSFPTVTGGDRGSHERPTEGGPEEGEGEEEDLALPRRSMTDLEIGMYALLGVFCLAILVFLINCVVFVLKYRHKRVPPEGQANVDHSHHWVFLGNGQPLRAQADMSPQAAESPGGGGGVGGPETSCCHGDHHSSGGSSQASVQSQAHGRGDGSSGGSARDSSAEDASSPTTKRKRVKFTTFASTLPAEELPYNAIPIADEEDIQWVCQDMGFQDPEELHAYMRTIKEIA